MAKRNKQPGDERFTDSPVSVVVDNPTTGSAWQAGYKAAKAGEPRLDSKSTNWKYGWDQRTYEERIE